jgi:glycosyltransferase involved in cell wall biosynthesis
MKLSARLMANSEIKALLLQFVKRARNRIALVWLRRHPLLAGFDADFYRGQYPDLRIFNTTYDLARHYVLHGASEGRINNHHEAIRRAESKDGALPVDFDAQMYRVLNEDLRSVLRKDWQYRLHYLQHGRWEGRPYRVLQNEALAEIASLNPECAKANLSLSDLWPNLLCLPEFVAYNSHWLPEQPKTAVSALRFFLRDGIERLAPLRFDAIFDPDFYRSAYPVSRTLSDGALYRHWLSVGLRKEWAPNEQAALRPMFGTGQFPESFKYAKYALGFPGRRTHRVHLLQHLFEGGFRKRRGRRCIDGPGMAQLLMAIARYNLRQGRHRNAMHAVDEAIESGLHTSAVFQMRGEIQSAIGNLSVAHLDYIKAASFADASVSSLVAVLRSAGRTGDFAGAFEIIERALPRFLGMSAFRIASRELVDAFFAFETQAVIDMYRGDRRSEADARMLRALKKITDIIDLEGTPPRMDPQPHGHVAILANLDAEQCKYYRVEQKIAQLELAGIEVRVCNFHDVNQFDRHILGASAVIVYRVPALPSVIRAIRAVNSLGIPTFYDMDDLIFASAHYPDTFESYGGQITRDIYVGLLYGVPLFEYAISLCKQGIASTTSLKEEMEKLLGAGNCHVLRNGLDSRSDAIVSLGGAPRPERSTVSIFYGSGTKAHNADFNDLAGPALLAMLEKHKHVRVVIAGHLGLDPRFDVYKDRIVRWEFTSDFAQYWTAMGGVDINIAVLAPGLAVDCKSEIKWLEAAVWQIPSVVSDTATYREVLQDGVDGLIARDVVSWTQALDLLICDSGLRRRIGAAARLKALRDYSIATSSQTMCRILGLQSTMAQCRRLVVENAAKVTVPRKKRVLVCAVFFPPQTFGGATRVVRDNIDRLLEAAPDIDFTVFTTDEGVSPPGLLRFDQYRGISVFRLSTPIKRFMDWEPFNPDNAKIFSELLDCIEPDLIHFHCIQRLSASIVEVARERAVPYLVTAHDAWWLSDHQFLVNENGFMHLPSSDCFADVPPSGIDSVASAARQIRLSALLAGAVHVLAVSKSFADIYRQAGCVNVITIENGVSKATLLPRAVRHDRRLSLGHIGSRTVHKGATLIEAILRTTQFDNLHLTMIDTTMSPGECQETIWGNTPVTLCPIYPQDKVGELYASLHVLLAPSIWPESFGLVTREARAHGLWVVASDRGAMGEGIAEEVDGFVVDVGGPEDLTRVMRILDADVERFSQQPGRVVRKVRTADDQAAELLVLYRSILNGPSANDAVI